MVTHTTHLGVSPHLPLLTRNLLRDRSSPTIGVVGRNRDTSYKTRTFARLKKGGDVDTRLYSLDRTASLSLQSFKTILAPRGALRCFLIVDPRECGYVHNPPRSVSTPPFTDEKPAKGPQIVPHTAN